MPLRKGKSKGEMVRKFRWGFALKKWTVILSKVDRFPLNKIRYNHLKISVVTFHSKSGPLSSQTLVAFTSKPLPLRTVAPSLPTVESRTMSR
jgi:hypothetical protein